MTTGTAAPTVVMGIIDDGIAFAHERFRKKAATRVEHWWLQDGPYLAGSTALPYGTELAKADIDALLKRCTRSGVVNEDELYQRAGLNDYRTDEHKSAAWCASHGTHVMDLACGFDSQAARDDRPIVCVQLPARVTADTSGANLCAFATAGIDYILNRADRIAQDRGVRILPVVINLSYGTLGGPHDGTSRFERFVDARIAYRKARGSTLDVVLPAGNSHLSRCHAQVDFPRTTSTVGLPWRILPDDQTPSYFDVWLPPNSGTSSRMALTVTPPGGTESLPVDEGSTGLLRWTDASGRVYCEAQYHFFGPPTARGRIRVNVQPTYSLDAAAAIAPAGLWTVRLKNKSLRPTERIHVWIQRDESLYGHPIRGRQSYLDDPRYQRYAPGGRDIEVDNAASPVRRASLLNALATGHESLVIGGYVRSTRGAAKYSAAGPTTKSLSTNKPPRPGPDALAPSDDSLAHEGVLAAASRSGGAIAMNGTSVSAPQIARWLAEQRANGIQTRSRDLIQARAQHDEIKGYVPGEPPPPPERGGSGRIILDPVIPRARRGD
jgi:hypothetical protein